MPSNSDTCPVELTESERAWFRAYASELSSGVTRANALESANKSTLPRNHADYTLAILAAKTPEALDELEEQAEAQHAIAEQEAHMLRRIVGKIRARRRRVTNATKAWVWLVESDKQILALMAREPNAQDFALMVPGLVAHVGKWSLVNECDGTVIRATCTLPAIGEYQVLTATRMEVSQ